MNLVDCYVTEITGPIQKTDWDDLERWWVPVNYESWGRPGESLIMCKTLEEAEAVKVGDVFLA